MARLVAAAPARPLERHPPASAVPAELYNGEADKSEAKFHRPATVFPLKLDVRASEPHEAHPADAAPRGIDGGPRDGGAPPTRVPAPAAPATHARVGVRKLLDRLRGRRDVVVTDYRDEDVTPIPPLAPTERVVEMRPIRPPFAFIRLLFDEARNTHRYEIIEPPLTREEADAFRFVRAPTWRSASTSSRTVTGCGSARSAGRASGTTWSATSSASASSTS